MLKSLYDYAMRNDLTLPAGYVKKTVKAYISFSSHSDYVGVVMGDDEAVPCPDIGSLANGTSKSNVIVEKRTVVIPSETSAKSEFFKDALKSAGEYNYAFSLCAQKLENENTVATINQLLNEHKVKGMDRISFMVDNIRLLDITELTDWWMVFREQFSNSEKPQTLPCLITGMPTVPMQTTPAIQGLQVVGGHARGDALICFDKSAFCSYGLKQGENAPVSEESYSAVKAALDELISGAPVLAGMKFVHWYDRNIQPEDDPIAHVGFGFDDDIDDDEDEVLSASEIRQEEREKINAGNKLIKSVESGERDISLGNTVYYILLLSGVNGRVMIRRYETGNYEALKTSINKWNEDLRLTNAYGKGEIKSCKFAARLIRLLKYQESDRNPFDRMSKELSSVCPAIIMSILNGSSLPDSVAAKALQNLRSLMMSSSDDVSWEFGLIAQWLKVWLRRNTEKGNQIMSVYNPDYDSTAYHCGALMAIYAVVQQKAMPDVNANIIQRYYSSAIQTPALVIGRLSNMSENYFRELEKKQKGIAVYYRKELVDTYAHIKNGIPNVLNLEEQSAFALGYYQKQADLFTKKDNKEEQ